MILWEEKPIEKDIVFPLSDFQDSPKSGVENSSEDEAKETRMINCFAVENDFIYLVTLFSIFVLNESMEYVKEISFK